MCVCVCVAQIPMSTSPSTAPHLNPAVDSLHLGVADPHLLLAACNDHALRLFDIRAPRMPVLTLMPFKAQIAGVALEPAGRPGIIVAGMYSSHCTCTMLCHAFRGVGMSAPS